MRGEHRKRWGLVGALRTGTRDLFPTRKTRSAMWGLVGLGVVITYLELMAADLFSNLITNIDGQSATETVLVMGGFLVAFLGVRGISYFQSVYRLTVFERALRHISSPTRAAESWRWPMAIALVGMMGQIARLATVTVVVTRTAWFYGVLLVLCSATAVLIVNRTGRRQYDIHHEFVAAKRSGNPPSAAERIGTRIRAGERAGLLTVAPVLVYVVALGVGAAEGRVTTHSALVLFIAGRMAANMYGGLANASMRFIRAQVNVEAFGGATPSPRGAAPRTPATDAEIMDRMASGGHLWEPPGQAIARLIDEGEFLGDVETLGRVARAAGSGPQQGLRKHAPTTHPDRVTAVAPNQVWLHEAYAIPLAGAQDTVVLHLVEDAFSRAIVGWRLDDRVEAAGIRAVFEETCRYEAVEPSEIDFRSAVTMLGARPTLHDLLKELNVTRTLLWIGPESDQVNARPGRPPFPTRFDDLALAEAWVRNFVPWYNETFYHPQVGYLHPAVVHAGLADVVTAERRGTLESLAVRNGTSLVNYPAEWLPPAEAWVSRTSITTVPRGIEDAEAQALDEDEEL